jgi:hypothetical protein
MKAVKAFGITLATVILIGVVFVTGKESIAKDINASAKSKTSITSQLTKTKSDTKKKKAANPITKAIVKEAINTYAQQADDDTKKVYESMSDEDKDKITEIIASNVSMDTIPTLQSYVSGGDSDALMKYANDNLTKEELAELTEILTRYSK